MSAEIGQPAPDFTLPSHLGGEVTLSQFKGQKNVVLGFFPLAFTSGWANEVSSFNRDLKRFEEKNAQVLCLSVDSVYVQKAFAMGLGGINFPVMGDFHPKGKAAEAYGVMGDKGFGRRATFIIDRSGIVRYKEVHAPGTLPDNQKLLAELAKL